MKNEFKVEKNSKLTPPPNKVRGQELREIKLFEAFAGIGSQFQALKNISKSKKWKIVHVGMIEWYVDAIIAYVAIHHNFKKFESEKLIKNFPISLNSKDLASSKTVEKLDNSIKAAYLNCSSTVFNNLFDIKSVKNDNVPRDIDIFTYSFPCQDLSIQGKQKGIGKTNKTRSGLLWEVKRILFDLKKNIDQSQMPKYLLMENVKNITSPRHLKEFNKWIKNLEQIGYSSKYYTLNSAHFGSCQNRERVFCISVRKDYQKKVDFEFPEFEVGSQKFSNVSLNDILETNVDRKYFQDKLSKYKITSWTKTKKDIIKASLINFSTFNSEAYIYDPKGKGPTLTASGANSRIKIITENNKIRLLTPKENYLYMGFSAKNFEDVNSTELLKDSKITYTAGNAIPVQVLEKIFATFKFGD